MGPDQRLRVSRCQGLPCLRGGKSLKPPQTDVKVPGNSLGCAAHPPTDVSDRFPTFTTARARQALLSPRDLAHLVTEGRQTNCHLADESTHRTGEHGVTRATHAKFQPLSKEVPCRSGTADARSAILIHLLIARMIRNPQAHSMPTARGQQHRYQPSASDRAPIQTASPRLTGESLMKNR